MALIFIIVISFAEKRWPEVKVYLSDGIASTLLIVLHSKRDQG